MIEKVSPKLIYRTILLQRYKDIGSLSDKPRSGRPRSARISGNLERSIRKMAHELSVNHEMMRTLVIEELWLKAFKRNKVHHLSPIIMTKSWLDRKHFFNGLLQGPMTRPSSQKRELSRLKRLGTAKMTNSCYQFYSGPRKHEIYR